MTNSKNTKRALLASVLSVVLCFAMLVGSTFAWFTDSASTGVNKIVAGNLAIPLREKHLAGLRMMDANRKRSFGSRDAPTIWSHSISKTTATSI